MTHVTLWGNFLDREGVTLIPQHFEWAAQICENSGTAEAEAALIVQF